MQGIYLGKLGDKEYLKFEKFQGCGDHEAEAFCRKYEKYKTYTHLLKEALIDSCTEIFKHHKELPV